MPTIIATGDAPDSGSSLSPARGGGSITRAGSAAGLGRGYRNCNRLRLLALMATASIVLAVWTASGRKPYREVTKDGRRPRVAVCFFGLARSLRWTLPSVQKRLLDVLKGEGMEVETFVHPYVMREVRSEREEGETGGCSSSSSSSSSCTLPRRVTAVAGRSCRRGGHHACCWATAHMRCPRKLRVNMLRCCYVWGTQHLLGNALLCVLHRLGDFWCDF